jgi:predicted Holliday junction resolvase-like endonuclease
MIESALLITVLILIYFLFTKKDKPQADLEPLKNENEFLRLKIEEQNHQAQEREDGLTKIINEMQDSRQQERSDFQARLNLQAQNIKELEEKFFDETEKRKKIVSQKKSGEVRLGHIAETLAPFLDQFEFDPEQCSFLGKPIDYISFGDNEITFIEVKSGNAKLNQRQRQIKDLVDKKMISWKEVRIK